jgi:hypothetical protein
MRSAWSPTRSMSFDTVFEVWPNCLLALPTVLATDFTSISGSGTPKTLFGRARLLSAKPPATPAAAAPTAIAGPPALPAAVFTVPTMPLPFFALEERWAAGRLDLLGFRVEAAGLERPFDERAFDALVLARLALFLLRLALLLLRLALLGLALLLLRLEPPWLRLEPLLAWLLDEAALLLAIPQPSPNRELGVPTGYPVCIRSNQTRERQASAPVGSSTAWATRSATAAGVRPTSSRSSAGLP